MPKWPAALPFLAEEKSDAEDEETRLQGAVRAAAIIYETASVRGDGTVCGVNLECGVNSAMLLKQKEIAARRSVARGVMS